MGRWEKTLKLSIKIDILLAFGITWVFLGNNLVGCGTPQMDSFVFGDFAYTGNIKINMAGVASNQLIIATSPTSTSLKYCIGLTDCQPANTNAYQTGNLLSSVSTAGKPKFFVVSLPNGLGDDMTINFMAIDSTGNTDHRIVKFQKPSPGAGLPSAPGAGANSGTASNTATANP